MKRKWGVERFDGVFGGWYADDGSTMTGTYLFRWMAYVAGWRKFG